MTDVNTAGMTPWAVKCHNCGTFPAFLVWLTREEYLAQLAAVDRFWACPRCHENANWDDDWHENCDAVAHCLATACGNKTEQDQLGDGTAISCCTDCPMGGYYRDISDKEEYDVLVAVAQEYYEK